MVARLAFAVATSIEAETILLDEILSVGDVSFRAQCASRVDRYVHGGSTVVVVSHELDAIESLCSRVIWISGGEVRADGAPSTVIEAYRSAAGTEAKEKDAVLVTSG